MSDDPGSIIRMKFEHIYEGDCPDEHQPEARDPYCAACVRMVIEEESSKETIRDRDARAAMAAVLPTMSAKDPSHLQELYEVTAAMAYDVADAMAKARQREEPSDE